MHDVTAGDRRRRHAAAVLDPGTRECAIVDRAVATWQAIQAAYDALLPQAIANHWNGATYDAEADALADHRNK